MSEPVKVTPTKEEWDLLFDNLPKEIQEEARRCEERDGELFVTFHLRTANISAISVYKPKG